MLLKTSRGKDTHRKIVKGAIRLHFLFQSAAGQVVGDTCLSSALPPAGGIGRIGIDNCDVPFADLPP